MYFWTLLIALYANALVTAAQQLDNSTEVADLLANNTVSEMVHYKLLYFNGRGNGECARQIFAVAGQQYEDVRLTHEQFAPMKPSRMLSSVLINKINKMDSADLPFGQVPVLEVDGKQLAQSAAIARYLARQYGLAGADPFEEALVDSLADQYADYRVEVKPYVYTLLGFMKAGDLDKLKKEVMMPGRDKFLGFITKFLKKSKSGKLPIIPTACALLNIVSIGFLVGDKVTWVDLLISEHMADMSARIPEFLDGFPEVKAHMEKVRSIPALKKWIETRPDTPF
ncbi:glutathione S-transferase protein [Oesophagostomum dentatum]|uniref:glutathione transferase n=1 Tax=Oesophagostomum dentatum TaxID=61180 RepID=A0A0B1SMS7_OESDE|nr:glutathione S-transferase protein [Oesophagostomum dentatum]